MAYSARSVSEGLGIAIGTLNAWFAPGSRYRFGVAVTAPGAKRLFTLDDVRTLALAQQLSQSRLMLEAAAHYARSVVDRVAELGIDAVPVVSLRWYADGSELPVIRFNDDVMGGPAEPGAIVILTINLREVFAAVERHFADVPQEPEARAEAVAASADDIARERERAADYQRAMKAVVERRKAAKERGQRKAKVTA
jgi:hypothetical protein